MYHGSAQIETCPDAEIKIPASKLRKYSAPMQEIEEQET